MTGTIVIKKLTTFASTSMTALKRIGSPLWRTLTHSPADDMISPKRALSVSIEKGGISTVFASRLLSKITIRGFRRYALEEDRYPHPEGLASSVALAINDLRASRTDITLSIPKSRVIIKTAEFPSTVKEDLSNAISYELDRLTPLSPEDAYYDFRVLEENAEKITILLMAAKVDSIKPYVDALSEKGITVSGVTVNLSSIGTLCSYSDNKADFTLVEISENGYEGASFRNGALTGAFTGTFTTGEEASKVDTILTELAPLMEEAQKQGRSPQMVFLLNDKSPRLKELLKLKITSPFRILNETDIKLKSPGPQREVSYAAIGGVLESLWPKATGLNLLTKGLHERPKKPVVLTLILMLAIIFSFGLYMIAPLKIEEKRLKEIDHQIMLRKDEVKKVEALKKEIEALSGEIATIENFKANRTMTQDILKELTNILPKNTWLTRVRITGATVDIEGYASSATGLLPKLEASKYLRKAEFASPTFRDAKLNADRFVIKVEIETANKVEEEKVEYEKE